MSTVAYAQLTNTREAAAPGTSRSTSPPGIRTYVDALAALVPAELLTLHALIIAATTKVEGAVTTIQNPRTLSWAFWALMVLGSMIYAAPRLLDRRWDPLDWLRFLIPSLAFAGWTMLQRATAFDAAFPAIEPATRTVIALFLAVIVGGAAAALASQADQKPAP